MINKFQFKKRLVIYWLVLSLPAFVSCIKQSPMLYKSDQFTVYSDKVVQGEYEAKATSPTRLISNYKSTASTNYSRLLTFKFSINEKDNEMVSGIDHWVIVNDEHQSPIIQFGKANGSIPKEPDTKLPVNYRYTFRVDMSQVLAQFKERAYYETFDGTRIAENDFKGVYIAGGSEPLTWDFSNLEENNLELKDPDKDGIYELTVILNPYNTDQKNIKEWILSTNVAAKPHYKSDQMLVDALFNLSLEEAILNIEADSTLRTGAKWGGVWTRDVSYSILLAFAYHEPEVGKISLMRKVKRGRIIQDTGSGGAWPVSSDRTTWSLAAWEIYKVTGDKKWLQKAYTILKNTLDDDEKTLSSKETALYRGESSFLDWREQTYPKWMSNKDIYMSENLGTNAVHYQAHIILAQMAKILDKEGDKYYQKAREIKAGINKSLWMAESGYYAQYLYGGNYLVKSPRFEALGEALTILFDIANKDQAKSIISNSPVTDFGTTCIYPQIPGIPPYHNNGIWPFVQSFWNLAAAKAGNEKVLCHGLASIYRAGALFLTNYENFVAENGDYEGTEINSSRMLWSMAGNLAMVHRVLMGMSFKTDGIKFNPVIPKKYGGTKILSNFKYRKAILDITVCGFGNEISSIKLDGKPLEHSFLPATVTGKHEVEIVMADNDFSSGNINLVKNEFSLPAPYVILSGKALRWNKIKGATNYKLLRNGNVIKTINTDVCEFETGKNGEYVVIAIDSHGFESFCSKPIMLYDKADEVILEMEHFFSKSNKPYSNYSGDGFVQITPSANKELIFPININNAGKYRIELRYSNGTGPWNTDNNCAIRSLYVNNNYEGVFVFPQRGTNEWSDWGYTNSVEADLNSGLNTIEISFKDWNTNMDGKINNAMIDHVRFVKIDSES